MDKKEILCDLKAITHKMNAYCHIERGIQENLEQLATDKDIHIEDVRGTINYTRNDFDILSELHFVLTDQLYALIEKLEGNKSIYEERGMKIL